MPQQVDNNETHSFICFNFFYIFEGEFTKKREKNLFWTLMIRSEEKTRDLLEKIIKGLSIISLHYSKIVKPTEDNCSPEEYKWLMKIQRA